MPLTAADVTCIFKVLGKCAYLMDLANQTREATLGFVEQTNTRQAADFDWFNAIILTAATRNKSALTTISTAVLSAANSYLTTVWAKEAGIESNAAALDVLEAIAPAMAANKMYLTPGGKLAQFVADDLGYPLPTAGTTLIPDTYVTGLPV